MRKVKIDEGRITYSKTSEKATFIFEGEYYDIVYNDYLSCGGEYFILDSYFAFETN